MSSLELASQEQLLIRRWIFPLKILPQNYEKFCLPLVWKQTLIILLNGLFSFLVSVGFQNFTCLLGMLYFMEIFLKFARQFLVRTSFTDYCWQNVTFKSIDQSTARIDQIDQTTDTLFLLLECVSNRPVASHHYHMIMIKMIMAKVKMAQTRPRCWPVSCLISINNTFGCQSTSKPALCLFVVV